MGLFTGRKITKATEAMKIAFDTGLAFRQMLALVGLEQEALKQSEAEMKVAEYMELTLRAIEKSNFNSGRASAAGYLAFGGIDKIKQTASLWEDHSALIAKVQEQYKNDVSNTAKEVSKQFSNAASAWEKVLEDFKSM